MKVKTDETINTNKIIGVGATKPGEKNGMAKHQK